MPSPEDVVEDLSKVDGFVASCVADSETGMVLAAKGRRDSLDLDVAAAHNAEVLRAEQKAMSKLDLDDTIEDVLIVLSRQYHLIRPTTQIDGLFVLLVLDKTEGNLAIARHQLTVAEGGLEI